MAQKRMFDKAIIDTDKFMDLPMSTKALYFLLGMEADDEGFVSPRKVMRIHGGHDDDIKVLITKEFLIPFQSGVVVITDWYTNNYLDKNRTKPTQYEKEKNLITAVSIGQNRNSSDKKYYLTSDKRCELNKCLTDVKLEEKRIEENSIKENRIEYKKGVKKFIKPTLDEVKEYCSDRNNDIDPDIFMDYYNSNGWKVGRNNMKDWKSTIRNWERRRKTDIAYKNKGSNLAEKLTKKINEQKI